MRTNQSAPMEISTNIQKSMDNNNNNDKKEPVKVELFEDSTHQYLIYFGHTKDCNALLIGLGAIIIEWVLLSIITAEAVELFKNDRVKVEVKFGNDCTDSSKLICEAETKSEKYAILGYTLLAIYLMGDVITAIKAFFTVSGLWSKIG